MPFPIMQQSLNEMGNVLLRTTGPIDFHTMPDLFMELITTRCGNGYIAQLLLKRIREIHGGQIYQGLLVVTTVSRIRYHVALNTGSWRKEWRRAICLHALLVDFLEASD